MLRDQLGEVRHPRRRDPLELHAAIQSSEWETIRERKLVTADACCICIIGERYPLHIALCKGAPEWLTLELIGHFPDACKRKIAGERYPLHLSLIFEGHSEDVSRAVLRAYPEACNSAEKVHKCYPLHLALRKKPPVSDTLAREIFECNPHACEKDDAYSRLPLHLCRNLTLDNQDLLPGGFQLAKDILDQHTDAVHKKDGCNKTPLELAKIGTVPLDLVSASPNAAELPANSSVPVGGPRIAAVSSRRRVPSQQHGSAVLLVEGHSITPRGGVNIHWENNRLRARAVHFRAAGPPAPVVGQVSPLPIDVVGTMKEYEDLLADEFEKDEKSRKVAAQAQREKKIREAYEKREKERREAEEAREKKRQEKRELDQARRRREDAARELRDLEKILKDVQFDRRAADREVEAMIRAVGTSGDNPAVQAAKARASDLRENERKILSKRNQASLRLEERTQTENREQYELELAEIEEHQQQAEALQAEVDVARIEEEVSLKQIEEQQHVQRDRDKEARQQVCAPSNEKVVQPTDQTVDTEAGRQRARWAAAIQSQVVRSSNQELTTSQRDTKVLESGDALLRSELIETHQMDATAYDEVQKRCKEWLLYNRFTDLCNNPVKEADLIAAWVYSMGPGGSAPNNCTCGHITIHGTEQAGTSCTCKPSPRNFQIYDKFNRSMRGVATMRRGEAEPEYQWFHYHLNNAVRHMPGAKAKQRLFRGQPNRYGVEYKPGETIVWKDYKSTSTDRRAALKFAKKRKVDDDPVYFEILGARDNLGAKFSTKPGLSAFPVEAEILLPAGATFVVKKAEQITLIMHAKEGETETEYNVLTVTLKYLGEWIRPKTGRLTQMCHGVSRCLPCAQKRNAVTGATKYRPSQGEQPNIAFAHSNAGDISGKASAASACQTTMLEGSHPKDHFGLADMTMQRVQQQRRQLQLREDDLLCYEITVEQGMAESDYEKVRARIQDWCSQVGSSGRMLRPDDAIAAWIWILRHKLEQIDTPQEDFMQLYYHLNNAVKTMPGVEDDGATLFRTKPALTDEEDKWYQKNHLVQWADHRFAFSNASSLLALDRGANTSSATSSVVLELRDIPANLGAYFGKNPRLSSEVSPDEVLLPANVTFRVVSRQDGRDKRRSRALSFKAAKRPEETSISANAATRIVLEFCGMDVQNEADGDADVHVLEHTIGLPPGEQLDTNDKKTTAAERRHANTMRKLRIKQRMRLVSTLAKAGSTGHAEGCGGQSDNDDDSSENESSEPSLASGPTKGVRLVDNGAPQLANKERVGRELAC